MENLQEGTPPEQEVNAGDSSKVFIGIILIVTLLLGGAVWIYVKLNKVAPMAVTEPVEVVEISNWKPEGSIYLSLSPKDENHSSIYKYNVATKQLDMYYGTKDGFALAGKFTNGNDPGLLISQLIVDGTLQIFNIDPEKDERHVMTNSSTTLKRQPTYIEAKNTLIYGGSDQNWNDSFRPNDFNVYVKTGSVEEQKLTFGAIPTLTPDGEAVVVLRNDGLYKVGVVNQTEEKIWGIDGNGTTTLGQQFAISPKGNYIAWTDPANAKIHFKKVDSWSPFVGYNDKIISATGFWPIFSPDEKYLAYQEVDWVKVEDGLSPKPRLVIINLATLERRIVQDLDEFDQLRMFINEWK